MATNEELANEIQGASETIATIARVMGGKLDQHTATLADVRLRLATMDTRLGAVDTRLFTVDERLNGMDAKLDRVLEILTRLEEKQS